MCAQVTQESYAAYSFASGMSWGFSGNLGFPLPANRSFNQIKEYQVTNGGDTFMLDRDVHRPKSDQGQGDINRPSSAAAAELIANIDELYSLAVSYGDGDPNRPVTDFYRQNDYADTQWKTLIGDVDRAFIDYAESRGAKLVSEFTDPFTGQVMGAEHLLATVAGHTVWPPLSDRGKANQGDVTGWGGDLMTFYGEWRRDSDSYASGYAYCTERLGKINVESTFAFRDLIEDADGFLLSERVRSGTPITTALREHYQQTGGATRFRDFRVKRFNTSQTTSEDAGHHMLTSTDVPIINLGRIVLEQQRGGLNMVLSHLLPDDMLREFCRGFAETLTAHAGLEAISQARMRSNHARLFTDGKA